MSSYAPLLAAIAFAAERHRAQRRKDADASPYINHPIAVAVVLAAEGGVDDQALLIAAVLHDTVEDTATTPAELAERFGAEVASLVAEVTDDKGLPAETRKELQVAHAAAASARARQLKLADKICNLRDLAAAPPPAWTAERRRAYVAWAERVAAGCRGANPRLDAAFDVAAATARVAVEAA